MTSTISHAPSVNLLTSSINVVARVRTAPTALIAARVDQPGDRSALQCLTMPTWDRVKPTNTPMANSGTSACVSPLDATSRAAASRARVTTPYRCTCRSARSPNMCGR